MRTNRFLLLLGLVIGSVFFASAHTYGIVRPSTVDQVNRLSRELGLSPSQYQQVYAAYDSYNRAVFDVNYTKKVTTHNPGRQVFGNSYANGNRGSSVARPGSNQRNNYGSMPAPGNTTYTFDYAKFERNRSTQESKLIKKMQNIFRYSPGQYARWEWLRSRELSEMF